MNKKKNIIILVLVFALLIGGASVLYTQLSKDDAPDGLLIQGVKKRMITKTKMINQAQTIQSGN